MAGLIETLRLHLQTLDRGIDEARGASGCPLLAQHVPGLERLAQFEPHAAVMDHASEREAEFALRLEPGRIDAIAGAGEIIENGQKLLPHEMREHEPVMQRRAPAHRRAALRLRSEEHTSELQSLRHLVCRLLLEKK